MNKAHILLVGNFDKKFVKDLHHDSWEIAHCPDSLSAIASLEQKAVDMVIARDVIDQLTGYQLCLLVKSHPALDNLPFIVLAEKKRQEYSLDGQLLTFPDRVAEFAETAKKPQSLVKLIKEELNNLYKVGQQKREHVKPLSLLPASLAPGLRNDLDNKLITALLIERLVSKTMLGLLGSAKMKTNLIKEFYRVAHSLIKADLCGLVIAGMHKPWLSVCSSKGLNEEAFNSLMQRVHENLTLTESLTIETLPKPEIGSGAKISDLILALILGEGASSGMLIFAKLNGQKFSALERTMINYMQSYAQPLIEFLLDRQEIDKLQGQHAVRAAIDPLTGLYNLEFLIGFLQQQLLFSARNKLSASLLMIDVDRFSQINDALGQAAGDMILVKLAEKFLTVIRSSDLLARYSSDKYVIVLPNTEMKGAKVLAEKLRLEVEQMDFFAGRQPRPGVTISIGCAQFDPSDLNPETILKDAKLALQRAKESGRNKVAV